MFCKNRVLAIIPARGGSKGVPRKNIRLLGGKPLIAWTIEIAHQAGNLDRIIVSTEDEEIAEIAVRHGAEVPFLRPGNLAKDDSIVGQACNYTLKRLKEEESYIPGGWAVLYPTHPFRRVEIVRLLVEKIIAGHRHVNTFTSVQARPYSFLHQTEKNTLIRVRDNGLDPTGNTYLFPSGYFIGTNSWPAFMQRPQYIHCLDDPVEKVDIDYLHDFFFAEEILKNKLFPFPS